MQTSIHKSEASICIDTSLLNTLRMEARADNRSLSDYLEMLLYRYGYRRDNPETLAALKEAKEGKSAGMVDVSSYDAFIKSVFDEED